MVETRKGAYQSRPSRSDPFPVIGSPITPASSLSLKSVWLRDWWLVKPKGKGLAVAGFATTGRLGGERLFHSAPISKRILTTMLETTDGINITISGLINRSRTQQNGFSFPVCQHFLLGFPHDWEEYSISEHDMSSGTYVCQHSELRNSNEHKEHSTQDTFEKCAKIGVPSNKQDFNEFMSSGTSENTSLPPLDTLSAIQIRDLVMGLSEDAENRMIGDILSELEKNACQHTPEVAHSKMEKRLPFMTSNYRKDGSPSNHKRAKTDQKHRNNEGILDARVVEANASSICSRGVVTRSMLRNLRSKPEQNILLDSCIVSTNISKKPEKIISQNSSTSMKRKINSQLLMADLEVGCSHEVLNQNPLKERPAAVPSKPDKGVNQASEISTVRRSGRLKPRKICVGMEN